MAETPSTQLSLVLAAIRAEESGATDRLFELVYEELHRVAANRMAGEKRAVTFQTTALVNEAYLRMFGGQAPQWENRRHFFAAAAEAMRRVLIDNARFRNRIKRGGDQEVVPLDSGVAIAAESEDAIEVSDALEKLAASYPEEAEVVKYRYYLDLSLAETAEILEMSERSVSNRWSFARAWLKRQMREPGSIEP